MCKCAVFFVLEQHNPKCIVWVSPQEVWRTHVKSLAIREAFKEMQRVQLFQMFILVAAVWWNHNNIPHINARMRIACKEKLTHVYLSSYKYIHMHCFSALLFVLILIDFSQMFWKNYCSLKACFPLKQLWHTYISWSHQKSSVCLKPVIFLTLQYLSLPVCQVFRTGDKEPDCLSSSMLSVPSAFIHS